MTTARSVKPRSDAAAVTSIRTPFSMACLRVWMLMMGRLRNPWRPPVIGKWEIWKDTLGRGSGHGGVLPPHPCGFRSLLIIIVRLSLAVLHRKQSGYRMDQSPPSAVPPASPKRVRLENIDALRGIVMIIMALDHSRDFFSNAHAYFNPIDVSKTTLAFFLIRWITDFCAPVFCFLAGTGVYLSASRGKSKMTIARMLVTRGLWLVFLELAVMRVCWYFNFDFTLVKAGVIWCLGWSMVALAGLIFLPKRALMILALVMIAGHNLLDGLKPSDFGDLSWLWTILHGTGYVKLFDGVKLLVVYPLIPWIGVMAAGYLCGQAVLWAPEVRRRRVFWAGLGLTLFFALVRGLNIYGDPHPWSTQPNSLFTFLNFLGCEKYPPSLSYLLMTMGPAFMLLAALDRSTLPRFVRPVVIFGRVPFLFYLLHLPLLHAMAIPWALFRYGSAPWLFANPPGLPWPHDFQFDLPLTYGAWLLTLILLYPVCRWFAGIKALRKDWWLSYL